jgi:hypothetical protein
VRVIPGQHSIVAVTRDKLYWSSDFTAGQDGSRVSIPLKSRAAERERDNVDKASLSRQKKDLTDELAKTKAKTRDFINETHLMSDSTARRRHEAADEWRSNALTVIKDYEGIYRRYISIASGYNSAADTISSNSSPNIVPGAAPWANTIAVAASIGLKGLAGNNLSRASKNLLAAHAVLNAIKWMTKLIGETYADDVIPWPRNSLITPSELSSSAAGTVTTANGAAYRWLDDDSWPYVFRVQSETGNGLLRVTQTGELQYEEKGIEAKAPATPTRTGVRSFDPNSSSRAGWCHHRGCGPSSFDLTCNQVKAFRPVGGPMLRNLGSLSDGSSFIVEPVDWLDQDEDHKTYKSSYRFSAQNKDERALILGYHYWSCPNSN